MKLHSVSRSSSGGGGGGGGDDGGSRTLADGLDSAVYTILSQYSRRQCRRRLLLASLVAMVYTVWWLLLLIPTVVVYMYYWVYRRRGARWRHASLYDRRSRRRRCRRQPATARAFPPPPPLFRFCVWPTRRIETGGRCDSILDGTVALLAFAGMVVSSWLTLSTSNSASIFKLRKRSFGRLLKQQNERPSRLYWQTKLYRLQFLS